MHSLPFVPLSPLECKFQNKAHRTLDTRNNFTPVHKNLDKQLVWVRKRDKLIIPLIFGPPWPYPVIPLKRWFNSSNLDSIQFFPPGSNIWDCESHYDSFKMAKLTRNSDSLKQSRPTSTTDYSQGIWPPPRPNERIDRNECPLRPKFTQNSCLHRASLSKKLAFGMA